MRRRRPDAYTQFYDFANWFSDLVHQNTQNRPMTVLLTTTLIAGIVFLALMVMRRGALDRVRPIQSIWRLRETHPRKSNAKASSDKDRKFHAVTIKLDPCPCPAVRPLAGQTLLSGNAPVLPLKDCDQAACKCRFIHHDDRRNQSRRGYQSDLAHVAAVGSNQERREGGTGRREGDWAGLE